MYGLAVLTHPREHWLPQGQKRGQIKTLAAFDFTKAMSIRFSKFQNSAKIGSILLGNVPILLFTFWVPEEP